MSRSRLFTQLRMETENGMKRWPTSTSSGCRCPSINLSLVGVDKVTSSDPAIGIPLSFPHISDYHIHIE